MRGRATLVTVALALAAAGCPVGTVGQAVAPEQITANTALEEKPIACEAIAGRVSPLIVDWPAASRLALELGMKEGVVVVSYTCEHFEVLDDCRARGGYAFAGVSRKEDVIQLTNRDEVRANLPFQALTFGGEMKRGATIDLALIRVGRHTTAVREVARAALAGECAGATHFVRAAAVGAFAMRSGTLGHIGAALEVFGATAGGLSHAEKQLTKNDGELSACRSSSAQASAPPDQCQAPIQLTLYPLTQGALAKTKAGRESGATTAVPAAREACPKGFVRAGDKCARRDQAKVFSCREDDAPGCAEQCGAGDADSCFNLGLLYQQGVVVRQDFERARKHFDKACAGEHALACRHAGLNALWACEATQKAASKAAASHAKAAASGGKGEKKGDKGTDNPPPPATAAIPVSCDDAKKAQVRGAVSACDGGIADACWTVAIYPQMLALSGRDEVALKQRACDLGHGSACGFLGMRYVKGERLKQNVKRGIQILERSCDAGKRLDCWWLAEVYRKGEAVPRNPRAQASALDRGCHAGYANACYEAGRLYDRGALGVTVDESIAIARWQTGCSQSFDAAASCFALGAMFRSMTHRSTPDSMEHKRATQRALAAFTRACSTGAKGCQDAVILAEKQVGITLNRACSGGNTKACKQLAQHMLVTACTAHNEQGCRELAVRDPEAARKVHQRICAAWGYRPSHDDCIAFVALGGTLPSGAPK